GEDHSQYFDGNSSQYKRGSQWRRREQHNRGQYQEPSRQQHQETHNLHSEIPRFKTKRLARILATLAKISQTRRNHMRGSNKSENDFRGALFADGSSKQDSNALISLSRQRKSYAR